MASALGPLTDADRALLAQLAMAIARRRMVMPAILFLESLKPLSYVGSQAMIFLRPFLTPFLNTERYERLTQILERREGLDALVQAIEQADAKREPVGRKP